MTRRLAVAAVLTLTLGIGVPPSATAAGPANRTESVVETDGGLQVSVVSFDLPMPADAAPHPTECDRVSYLRYRWADAPSDPQQTDGVVVGQPGAFLGAYGLDRLARNTLRELSARGQQLEWWSLHPRMTCAFDMTGIAAANHTRDYHVAWDYYFEGKPIGGKTFAGWKPDAELAYLADLGAAQLVNDQWAILTHELPDQRFRATRMFCGGHSDGALAQGWFAAWDFGEGNPENAGYHNCRALFAFEGVATGDPAGAKDDPFTKLATDTLAGRSYEASVAAVKAGVLPRSFSQIPTLNPEWWTLLMIAGNAAHHRPDAETDLNKLAARVPALERALRVAFSRNHADFFTGLNNIGTFRFTNEAFLGSLLDDNSLNLALFQFSLGALSGGPVAPKDFPWNDPAVKAIPFLGDQLTGSLTGSGVRMGPTSHTALYTWRNYDEVADVPFTTPADEVVDIGDFARQLSAAPLSWADPYFTFRFEIVDNFQIQYGARSGDLAPMIYDQQAKAEPTLTVWSRDSQEAYLFGPWLPPDTVWVDGYGHFDPPFGAATQNDREPEPFSDSLAGFITQSPGAAREST